MVNVLLARYGKDDGASLHHIVYITMLTKVDKAAPEYGSYFLALMDRHCHSYVSRGSY